MAILTKQQAERLIELCEQGFQQLQPCRRDLFNADGTCGCAVAAMLQALGLEKPYKRNWKEYLTVSFGRFGYGYATRSSDNAAKRVLRAVGIYPLTKIVINGIPVALYNWLYVQFDKTTTNEEYYAWIRSLAQED